MTMKRRMLDPDFWGDADIIKAFPYPGDYPGRSLYQFLWNYADDSGVFTPSIGDIKIRFAGGDTFTEEMITAWCGRLVDLGKVIPFSAGGRVYGWIRNFAKHQAIQHPAPPRLPIPPWVRWHGKESIEQRHLWYYEILWDQVPAAGQYAKGLTLPSPSSPAAPPPEPDALAEPAIPPVPRVGDIVRFGEGTEQYDLAREFRTMVRNVPGTPVPAESPHGLRRWSLVMGLMLEAGTTASELRKAIAYIQPDPFWSRRILTPDNMRDQWGALHAQLERGGRSPIPGIDPGALPASLQKHAALARKVREMREGEQPEVPGEPKKEGTAK